MEDKYIKRANNNTTYKFLLIILPNSKEIFIFHVEVGK